MKRGELERRLRTVREPAAPPALRARLERGIPDSLQRPESQAGPWRWSVMARWSVLSATALSVVAGAAWLAMALFGPAVAFAAALEPVARATGQVGAVHVVMRMLALEGEDFSYVNAGGTPQRVEAWVQWPVRPGDAGRLRIDKTDRIYVFDGATSIYFHPLRGEAYRGHGVGMDLDLFWPGAWVRQIRSLPADGVQVLEQREVNGRGHLLLREKGRKTGARRPAFLGEFDRETEVEWDLRTHLLTGLKRWVYDGGERLLFLELDAIEYLPAIEASRFSIDLPADVRWGGVREAPDAVASLGPRQVARRLFEAALSGDRVMLELLVPSPNTVDWLLDDAHRPAEVLFIGEPFRSGDYPGVYVPYQVRLGGLLKAHQLALRNDNEQGRWVYDGGL